MQLATSADYYFGADSIALRATFRFGAKIADAEHVVKLTVAASDSQPLTWAPGSSNF